MRRAFLCPQCRLVVLAPVLPVADDAAMSDTLSVSEAATVAGVSVRTMRRRMASGQVVTVGSGHKRRVVAASLSENAASSDTSGQPDRTQSDTSATKTVEAVHLAALVRELTAQVADQAAVAAMWQERARSLSDQLALAAPESPQEAPTGAIGRFMAPRSRTAAIVALVAAMAAIVGAVVSRMFW